MNGNLILFPVPIGGGLDASIPEANRALLNSCRAFIVEDIRTARRNLHFMGYEHPIDEVQFFELSEHTDPADIGHYLDLLAEGENMGLMSEAGLPCVADPGVLITDMAQRRGIEVVPLVGPSSLLMALMASGFNGQNFAFNGYLPYDKAKRTAQLRLMEQRIYREHQTQLLIEAPYRNDKLLSELSRVLQSTTRICVACDIMLPTQYIRTLYARQWAERPHVGGQPLSLNKRNTVFLLYQ